MIGELQTSLCTPTISVHCLKLRREVTRNTNGKLTFKCIQAEVELEVLQIDKSLHINKIIREVKK